MKDNEIEIAVQINGKTKGTVMVPAETAKKKIMVSAKEAIVDKIVSSIVKEIYVPGKIVNLVVK